MAKKPKEISLARCNDNRVHVFRWRDDGPADQPLCGGDVAVVVGVTEDDEACETCYAAVSTWVNPG